MKAKIAGYSVVVGWSHILSVAAAIFGAGIVLVAIAWVLTYAMSGQLSGEIFVGVSTSLTTLASIFFLPVFAWIFLRGAKKRDETFCRSMSCAFFLVSAAFAAVETVWVIALFQDSSPMFTLRESFNLLQRIALTLIGAVIVYLWMLFFLKPERKRLETAAIYGAVFAGVLMLAEPLAVFIVEYAAGQVYTPKIDYTTAVAVAKDAIFAFIVLYHAGGRKMTKEASVFSGLFLAGPLIMVLSIAVAGPEAYLSVSLITLTEHIARLALLYLIIRNWKEGGTL